MHVNGLTPVIVHPKRTRRLIEEPEIQYKLVQNGALSQITASSLQGEFVKKLGESPFC